MIKANYKVFFAKIFDDEVEQDVEEIIVPLNMP